MAFQTLFYSKTKKGKSITTRSLSSTIMMFGVQYDFTSSTGTMHQVVFKSIEAVNDVLRLYYKARCIFYHGLPKGVGRLFIEEFLTGRTRKIFSKPRPLVTTPTN